MAGKPIRLGKAAGELNVGISTLVEFLDSKGIKIDVNPNTKLEGEHYDILQKEFAADQTMKEKSKFSAVKREKRETISIRDSKQDEAPQKTDDEDDSDPINMEEIKRNVFEEPQKVVEEKQPEVVATPEPVAAHVVEGAPEVVEKPEVSEAKTIGEGDVQVQVIGKIDLDKLNTKTRPDKKKHQNEETAKPAPVVEKPKAVEPIAEEKTEVEQVEPEAPREIETIRVERKVLTGPTVLGRIELPVDRPKTSNKPGANAAADARKKRKRIKKVDPNAPASAPGSATPAKPGGFQGNQGAGNKNFKKGGAAPKFDKPEIKEKDIQKEIKDTLARLSNQGGKSKASKNRRAKRDYVAQRRQDEMEAAEMEEKILKLTEFVTVSELASMMNTQPTAVISACMSLGIFASINQRLDAETIQIVADEFGFEAQFVSAEVQEAIPVVEDKEEDLVDRPPIITVMGHVDHGKTSLLDKIRNANVTAGEAGGITQHIGAYSVTLKDGRKMTFLDTPGHEAFTAMRARGAQITDVAIIIVAADDDVMPQTKEAISHAQAAGVPMVFAINKIDKPGANPNKNALGTVIESSLDKGKGYVTNMLVEAGTLKIGDIVLVGRNYGRVRAMHDEHGLSIKEAGPSKPVSILGINGAPSEGDKFHVMDEEREAKAIATKREQLYREQGLRTTKHITLDEIGRRLAIGDFKELNIIVKGDVDGSIEALSDSLLNLSTPEIQVNIVHKGVGAISEADVNLASASDAIIIGFQVRPSLAARKLAENEQIDIRLYSVIYKAIEEIKSAMEGMLSPDIEEKIVGSAEIRETFDITKVGTIAGCYVLDGIIKRSNKVRIIRDGIVIHSGVLGSLKRFKDDVREVKNNYECGLNIDKFNDIKIGDIVESYEEVEVARKL